MSSSSSVNSRRSYGCPSVLSYHTVRCNNMPCHQSKTILSVSNSPRNIGKLCYICERCRRFVGWAIPAGTLGLPSYNRNLAYVIVPGGRQVGPVSPSVHVYRPYYCRTCSLGQPVPIRVSESTTNPGKLYYSCPDCQKFCGWCNPIETAEQPVELSLDNDSIPTDVSGMNQLGWRLSGVVSYVISVAIGVAIGVIIGWYT